MCLFFHDVLQILLVGQQVKAAPTQFVCLTSPKPPICVHTDITLSVQLLTCTSRTRNAAADRCAFKYYQFTARRLIGLRNACLQGLLSRNARPNINNHLLLNSTWCRSDESFVRLLFLLLIRCSRLLNVRYRAGNNDRNKSSTDSESLITRPRTCLLYNVVT